tara:strand:+ start:3499 stop:3825 length:327 start_codon:yes stop_codon:yes gene_type:complete
MSEKRDGKQDSGVGLKDREKIKLQKPPKYKILMYNDDYTPMQFVSDLIVTVFHKTRPQADEITIRIHKANKAIVGVYTREIADTKKHVCVSLSKASGHPLMVEIEPEE